MNTRFKLCACCFCVIVFVVIFYLGFVVALVLSIIIGSINLILKFGKKGVNNS